MNYLTSLILVIIMLPFDLFAADTAKGVDGMSWSVFVIVLSSIISGIIGYIVGTVKFFREEKQKAYGEIIPPILKMAYDPKDSSDEKEYSKALAKLWLYGSKKVAHKMEHALKLMHDPSRGNAGKALQEAIVEMRRDIQLFPWQRIKPEEVGHLYSSVPKIENNNKNT